jgi:hypothetical protein
MITTRLVWGEIDRRRDMMGLGDPLDPPPEARQPPAPSPTAAPPLLGVLGQWLESSGRQLQAWGALTGNGHAHRFNGE